jgi:hypothetical protein
MIVDFNKVLTNETPTDRLTHRQWTEVLENVEVLRLRVSAHVLAAYLSERNEAGPATKAARKDGFLK